ncbi:hypothetical protein AKJ09_05006 [Labilithrix luteola]|uniref:Uncharacterized protein n=1 Tax=Labilithrix luteola TaxID=1391654 RepID=A0A0K1PXV6_9BACT|nr:hypothetical protein AKJ09_05006 [Labilithrix luteola]
MGVRRKNHWAGRSLRRVIRAGAARKYTDGGDDECKRPRYP